MLEGSRGRGGGSLDTTIRFRFHFAALRPGAECRITVDYDRRLAVSKPSKPRISRAVACNEAFIYWLTIY